MSFQSQIYSPPPIPHSFLEANDFRSLRDGVKQYLIARGNYDKDYLVQLANNHNKNAQAFGPNVASAASIQIGPELQQIVTGSAAIDQILPPAGFNGFKALYSRDGFSLVAGGPLPGAIATPLTTTPGILVLLLYFPPTEEWAVISAVFAGTLPSGSVGPSQLQTGAVTAPAIATGAVTAPAIGAGAVTTPAIGAAAVTTAKVANNAITTPLLASGAATKGTSAIDATSQNITPYATPVQIISLTATIDSTSDYVEGSCVILGNGSGIQSSDGMTYFVFRNAVQIQTGILQLTLSSATQVGGQWVSVVNFTDGGVSGSITYSIKLQTNNGSGAGTVTEQKTAAQMQVIDHRAQ